MLIRPHTRTTKGNKMCWNMWQPKITAFNNDSVMQLLPCFQRLFAVLEECLLGGACAFVSIGGQKSPQSSSAPEGKSSWLCRGAGWGYCRETLNLCPPALHKQLLEKSIEDKPGLWGWLSSKAPTSIQDPPAVSILGPLEVSAKREDFLNWPHRRSGLRRSLVRCIVFFIFCLRWVINHSLSICQND